MFLHVNFDFFNIVFTSFHCQLKELKELKEKVIQNAAVLVYCIQNVQRCPVCFLPAIRTELPQALTLSCHQTEAHSYQRRPLFNSQTMFDEMASAS